MNKTKILKELSLKNIWNKTHIVNGVKVAGVMWHDKQWKVLADYMEFDDVSDSWEEKRKYQPIAEFKYQTELADYIYNSHKK